MSPSTEEYDRGENLEHYRRIPTLRHVVLVAHDERRVDVWTRTQDGSWTSVEGRDRDVVELPAVGARFDVNELYEGAAAP